MDYLNFSFDEDTNTARLTKSALVFVEGNHTDSSKREHYFGRDRILKIVDNTNNFFRLGGRIPFQRDHKKDQNNNLGDIESEFYTREITGEDKVGQKYKHLVGKLGVFVDNIVAKGSQVIRDIQNNNISTLSPGIDPAREAFIEVSATPIPAIIGPTLFSQSGEEDDNVIFFESSFYGDAMMNKDKAKNNLVKNKAFSFKDLEELNHNMDEMKEEYRDLGSGLFKILYDLLTSSEEELQGVNPVESSYAAIEHFNKKLEKLFKLTSQKETEEKISPVPTKAQNVSTGRPFPVGVQPSDFSRNKKSLGFKRY